MKTYQIAIFVNGVHREFEVDEDKIITKDWNAVIEDMKGTVDNSIV